jgi:hypothetical protein
MQPVSLGPLTLDNPPVERVLEVLAALYKGTFVFTPSKVDCTIVTVG